MHTQNEYILCAEKMSFTVVTCKTSVNFVHFWHLKHFLSKKVNMAPKDTIDISKKCTARVHLGIDYVLCYVCNARHSTAHYKEIWLAIQMTTLANIQSSVHRPLGISILAHTVERDSWWLVHAGTHHYAADKIFFLPFADYTYNIPLKC